MTLEQRRNQLLQCYQLALNAVSGEEAVARFLHQHPIAERHSLIAIGKAAAAMAKGAERAAGEQLRCGLVITKHGHGNPALDREKYRQLESSHPIPDESSLQAGDALLDFLAQLPEGEPLLFLLSGGASALAEVLPAGVTAQQLAELNGWLLATGLSIGEMNAIRKRLSGIKGGRLIPYLKGRPCLQLLISDVPGDALAVIGSGPLIADGAPPVSETLLPEWLHQLLSKEATAAPALPANITSHIIASNERAREAVEAAVRQLGVSVFEHPGHFQGDAVVLGAQFCDELLTRPAGIYLWGGESSVVLPKHPGRGGRNQQLALAAARRLAGQGNLLLLAAGTDGSDGPTEDAGALVDGGTMQRGEWEGLNPLEALESADAGSFLEASGDLIQTGPTGTNVMDLVIAWKW
jgi:hydroxypyruvate reductase